MPRKAIYTGTFIHTPTPSSLQILHNTAIFVSSTAKIDHIHCDVEPHTDLHALHPEYSDAAIVTASPSNNQFFFPGLIDTHIHAPQYPNSGIFGKSTLLDWLETYTFPMESSLQDIQKAKKVYGRVVRRTLSHGTTTAAYYATIHVPSTNLLADLCHGRGQRAFIGRCCMDRPKISPEYYKDIDAATAIADTKKTIAHCSKIDAKRNLICPIITPRFAPSCTEDLLTKLGELAKHTGLPIQTHISENKSEIELVKKLFGHKSYAEVYDSYNLLTEKTVLAHAVWLEPSEISLIAKRKAKISHCPVSNSSLSSGAAWVKKLMKEGITVGLGTDVSGGYSPSVLEAARHATLVSRHVAVSEEDDTAKLSVEEALYLATRGGAEVVGLGEKVGAFEVGMEWDALLVTLGRNVPEEEEKRGIARGPVDVFGWEKWDEKVAKWLYCGDDRNVEKVWVRGELVHEREKC